MEVQPCGKGCEWRRAFWTAIADITKNGRVSQGGFCKVGVVAAGGERRGWKERGKERVSWDKKGPQAWCEVRRSEAKCKEQCRVSELKPSKGLVGE